MFLRKLLYKSTVSYGVLVMLGLGFLLFHGAAWGAVAFNALTSSFDQTATPITVAHTTAGSNRALLVFVGLENTGQTVSGITYAGTALSVIGTQNILTNGRIELWGLANPATGANNVVVTLSAANTSADIVALSFTGAQQTFATAFTGYQVATSSGATVSNTVTTGSVGDMVFSAGANVLESTPISSSQTNRWINTSGNVNDLGSTAAGGASVTMTETWDFADSVPEVNKAAFAVNIVQFSAGGKPIGQFPRAQ